MQNDNFGKKRVIWLKCLGLLKTDADGLNIIELIAFSENEFLSKPSVSINVVVITFYYCIMLPQTLFIALVIASVDKN